jgi:aminopeptidase N
MISLVLTAAMAATTAAAAPGPGVPHDLARARAAAVTAIRYDVFFGIPAQRSEPVQGRVLARFSLLAQQPVVLDFEQPADRVRGVAVSGRPVTFELVNGHIVVPASATRAGQNEVAVEFLAGDEPLNRNDDFLYTLFVPARARLAFPCFDQPDLKAHYKLTLEIPADWQAVANGAEIDDAADAVAPASDLPAGRRRVRFAETSPLPTYLFAFAAGRFSMETASRGGRTLRMFHRETDAAKVARNRETVFDLHAAALSWLEQYTGIGYPFGKFDFVLIPSFQFGGMEHAAAIFYNASALLLEESATQRELLMRAGLIAHETSHMWFGDLVTMRWFDDVWLKEVFANFMAAKIVNPAFPEINHELRFLFAHYPAAYQVDRSAGTNPIHQVLDNLSDASQLYGPIIYDKAAVVMRQLEMMAGEGGFRRAVHEYLARHAFGNATWQDLVGLMDAQTPDNVREWSRAWVEERGRPTVTTKLQLGPEDRVSSAVLEATDPFGRGLIWPQRLRITLGYPGSMKELPVYARSARTPLEDTAGQPAPDYVLVNGAGLGYGLFILDDRSRDYLLAHIEDIPDALTRGSAWVTLWDNLLEQRFTATAFLDTAMRALPQEQDEQVAQRVLASVTRAFWRFLPVAERAARSDALESLLFSGIATAPTRSRKAAWFNAWRDILQSDGGVARLARIWRREEQISGLSFAETDETTMALELAVREAPGWEEILRAQHERIQNPDRKARFAFVMPALAADPGVREAAFERFRSVENRRREPWVIESLQYLNHPLREAHARRFIGPALDQLEEIQRTGDIFFPGRWMEATLWGHRSPEAATQVQAFLAAHPAYPQRLRWTILSSADELFRAAR